ncbi:GntR family transcriptional regulator [Lactobacillus sp. ESL0263]|uniref:GntR family transcriptional regulator n=1 Tax=Lactobacillus sp. ESL0263 TaxID=2069350 RepID=UPI000EFA7AAC|nr:GntR family transcriptional regulator [Lactobacillus sp. ESL0263]RMC51047.1 GntR family transcriptional regulator [Lactobacillus sp. ESL0263]
MKTLSEQFDVSRVTLRKAIKGLADDGLVEKIQVVGTFVRQPQKVKRIVSSLAIEHRLSNESIRSMKNRLCLNVIIFPYLVLKS